jgi:hypothetical protein
MRVTARSALPVDLIGAETYDPVTGAAVNFHPNIVPGQPLYLHGSLYPGGKVINYDAFTYPKSGEPGYGEEGDTPRNYLDGFGAWQLNSAIRREFPIHERLHLQFRAEAFNLFNHPSFGAIQNNWLRGPYNPSCLCGFGAAQTTGRLGNLNSLYATGGPRSLQLALKLLF